jgi:RNA polymerase sigma-70 factor (ECF subfamily)
MQESDEQRWSALMVSAQEGNESDYRQLLGELSGVAQGFLRNRFGGHSLVDDCVQEALLAVHQARHTYDPNRLFRPWFFAIVRYAAIDTLRRQQRRERVAERYRRAQRLLGEPVGQSACGDEHIDDTLLRALSRPYREVLVLTKVFGFSIAEAAERLDISESAIKVRVHRAKQKLRQLMAVNDS